MKKLLLALISVLLTKGSVAQGVLEFNNRGLRDPVTGFYDAPVSLPGGSLAAGAAFTAGLYLVAGSELTLVGTTVFRTGAAAGFFVPVEMAVPGVPPQSSATFRVRVWETAAGSYGNAAGTGMLHGEFPSTRGDNNIFVPNLAGISIPEDIPRLNGMLPLTLVPEPTTFALGAVGALLVLLGCRRG